MTSAEWAAAADRGDPRTLGRAIQAALAQAAADGGMHPEPDWDDTYKPVQDHFIRAGELLREQGWIAPQLPASRDFPTDQDDQRG